MGSNQFFIGGTGRSGTTILSKILSDHPDITNVPEWRFLVDPDGIVDFYTSCAQWSPFHFDVRLKRLACLLKQVEKKNIFNVFWQVLNNTGLVGKFTINLKPRYNNLNVTAFCPNFRNICDTLIGQLETFRFQGSWVGSLLLTPMQMSYGAINRQQQIMEVLRDFLLAVMADVMEQQGASCYLEKNTWNILWFDKILEFLPNAKLLHIYRDPRDVVSSYVRQTWMPSDPVLSARIYCDLLDRWQQIRTAIPVDSYYEISLESLVEAPRDVLSDICLFLDVLWDDCLLDLSLEHSHSGRWKKDLSKSQQVDVIAILGKVMQQYGYGQN